MIFKFEKAEPLYVVIRSNESGVWFGEMPTSHTAGKGPSTLLKDLGYTECGSDGGRLIVLLDNARRAWSWDGALSCSELANSGPTGGQICAPVKTAIIADVCELLVCSPDAVKRWTEIPAPVQ